MQLQALIFDVDGTLADTEEAHRSAFNEAFQQYGLDWHWSRPKYAELLRTTGGKERIGVYVDSLGLTPDEQRPIRERIAAMHATKTDIYTRMVRSGAVPLREGVTALLEEARRAQVALAIATTTSLANIDALLSTHLGPDALTLFSVIGAGDQVTRKKPAPDIYQWVLGQLALPASACVAVEDSVNGVRSAKGAGLFTLVTPSYWTESEDFTAADWVLPSLASSVGLLGSLASAMAGGKLPGSSQDKAKIRLA